MFSTAQALLLTSFSLLQTYRMCSYPSCSQRVINDMDLQNWFQSDSLSDNLRTVVNKVILTPEPEVSPITYSSDSEYCFFIIQMNCHIFIIVKICKTMRY